MCSIFVLHAHLPSEVLWMTNMNHESRESLCYIAAINMRIGNRWDSSSDITHAPLLHSSTALSIWFYSNLTRLFVVKSATFWLYAISHSIWRPPIPQLPQCEHYTHLFCCFFSSPWGRSGKPLPSRCLFLDLTFIPLW